ncbi:MAG: WbqC family protein [Betaproteobacteria bacterium]|nr:WbqC family protein [Betaproteobacteria bacterium]
MTDVAPSRRVAILQSNYVPWKGYFDIIHDVDLFIFYDDNQYTTADWRNRNQIKAAGGVDWISIPVGENRKRLICDVTIPDSRWQAKHWRTITQNYGKCPYFDRYRDAMQEIYLGRTWLNLSELNQTLIRLISTEFLGISTQFADSRQYAAVGQKLDRLVDLVQKSGATTYVSGPSAKDYIVPERFHDIDVELRWKDYSGYPEYPQRFPPFAHGVTILDLLFNVGERAPWYIWGWRDEVPTSS